MDTLQKEYSLLCEHTMEAAIDHIYTSFPDLLIMEVGPQDKKMLKNLNTLKGDPLFYQLPVLLIIEGKTENIHWEDIHAEDYIRKQDLLSEIKNRVKLAILRAKRVVEINPLTRLPGNISITREIQNRLDSGEIFALAYLDLDNFKPYNDHYGFARGDDVIRMTGRLIMNVVRNAQEEGSFVGHIGGDDFVYIMDIEKIESVTNDIIKNFTEIIPAFYEEEDRKRGYIESLDRQGNIRRYPLMTISVGIAHNKYRKFVHHGEISSVASEMKKEAKRGNTSSYLIDRRKR
ncbi:MAG: diguanylate cyclase [Deltaproteobacteria bacterium]|nr:diguanylate cyclase [Deltaproteobacteria bacterium]